MLFVLIGLVIFLLLVLVAIRVSFNNKETSVEISNPLLHASGIYSIVRKNPREKIDQHKPSVEEIRKYLECINVDSNDAVQLSGEAREQLVQKWTESLNKNIEVIEQGDSRGVTFYYYDFSPESCPVCQGYLKKGQFVTREELFQHPQIIPPFHLGCTCTLFAHSGKEILQETTEIGMIPLFKNEIFPRLPEWRMISPSNAVRGTIA
jgi:hypothetical protein